MKKALITGVSGQDGSYLAELLLKKGYEVHGLLRRASTFNTHRLDGIYRDPHEAGVRFFMHYGDLSDSGSLNHLIRDLEPDEIYNLGAQSHVKVSFDIPEYTADVTGMGTIARACYAPSKRVGSDDPLTVVVEPVRLGARTVLDRRREYGAGSSPWLWSEMVVQLGSRVGLLILATSPSAQEPDLNRLSEVLRTAISR